MPFLTRPYAALLPFTTKPTDDAANSLFGLLSLMVWGLASHRTWVGIVMPSFFASNSSRIFCRPSVPFPMYRTRGTAWIFSLSQVSFPSTSTTPLSTVLAAVMMRSQYRRAISAVAFWCVIAVMVPFAFLLAFMIQMWAAASWWNSALLIADAISWSILLGSGTLSSLLRIRHLSAMLEPVVRAGAGLASFFWFRGGTVSHRLVGVGAGADVVAPFGVDVALGVGVVVGAGFGAGAGARFGFGFGFGVGAELSCCPGCSCWSSSGLFGSPVCVRSAGIEASRPTPSVSAFISSLWPRSVVATTLLTMSVMPLPHSTSSWWYTSRFSSLSSNHVFIPRHCASCSVVCVSSMFAIFAMVRCSCASSRAGC